MCERVRDAFLSSCDVRSTAEKPDVFDSDFNESEDDSSDDDKEESELRRSGGGRLHFFW